MDAIDARKPDLVPRSHFRINDEPLRVTVPEGMFRQLRAYEELLGKHTDALPYRHQIQLNALTEALCILTNKRKITQEHIDAISWLVNWINYDFKEI